MSVRATTEQMRPNLGCSNLENLKSWVENQFQNSGLKTTVIFNVRLANPAGLYHTLDDVINHNYKLSHFLTTFLRQESTSFLPA